MNDMTIKNAKDGRSSQPDGHSRIVINIDGACRGNPGPGGYAAVIQRFQGDTEVKKRVIKGRARDTTNKRMEYTAVIKALSCLKTTEASPIIVRSNSLILIQSMTEWLPKWIANGWRKSRGKPTENRDLLEEMHRLSKGRNITWIWVKGHMGDPMNVEVDRLAGVEARSVQAPILTA